MKTTKEHLNNARTSWGLAKQEPITEADIPGLVDMIDMLFLLHDVRDQQEVYRESVRASDLS